MADSARTGRSGNGCFKVTGSTPEEAWRKAYADSKASMSAREYSRLTGSDDKNPRSFRRIVASDPDAFDQQLRFSGQRVGYIGLLALLTGLGTAPWVAGLILSMLPTAALLVFGAVDLSRGKLDWRAVAAVVGFSATLVQSRVGVLTGPDALGIGLEMVGCVLFLGNAPRWGIALMLAALLFRPEFALLNVLLGVACRSQRGPAVALACGSVAVFGILSKLWPSYGFAALMRQTFAGAYPYPARDAAHWSVAQHLGAIQSRLPGSLLVNVVVLALIACVAFAWRRLDAVPRAMAAGALIYFAAMILLDPFPDPRYCAIAGLILALSLVWGREEHADAAMSERP